MRNLLILLTLIMTEAMAAEPTKPDAEQAHDDDYTTLEYDFSPDRWTRGLHLISGIGINTSRVRSERDLIRGGVGLNIKTDLGWYVNPNYAPEIGVIVNFNLAKDLLIWESVFTIGVRTRIPFVPYTSRSAPYLKPFVGYGPQVLFFRNHLPVVNGQEAERTHSHGPAAGMNIGLFKEGSNGTVWFIEFTGMIQWLVHSDYVRNIGDVPQVLGEGPYNEEATQSSALFTVGLLAF